MKNIVIMGATLQSGNRGVNALTRGTIEALLDKVGDANINILRICREHSCESKMFHEDKEYKIREITCSAQELIKLFLCCAIRNSFLKFLANKYFLDHDVTRYLATADYIFDLSEGDSFSDIYGYKRFIIHSLNKLMVLSLGKELILLPQTIGPFKNSVVKIIAKHILKNAKNIFTRDELSFNVVCNEREFNINKQNVIIAPDMAFYMKPDKSIVFATNLNDMSNSVVVGVNISGLLYNGGYTKDNMFDLKMDYKQLMRNMIRNLFTDNNVRILLIPHVFTHGPEKIEDDLTTCQTLYEELQLEYPGKIAYIDKPYQEHEIKNIIGGCDYFIGARMHACIGAISMGVPTTPIAYSRKFLGVWKMFGLEKFVADPRSNSEEEIMRIVSRGLTERQNIKTYMQNNMKDIRPRIINSVFRDIEM